MTARIVETDRLALTSWSLEMIDMFRPIASNPEVTRYINDGAPWTDTQIAYFIGRQVAFQTVLGHSMWAMWHRSDDRLIGVCGLQPLHDTAEFEIGWWLTPECRGQGLATEAAQATADHAFAAHRLQRIVAIIDPDNRTSQAVAERIGMRRVGDYVTPADIQVMLFGLDRPMPAQGHPV